MSELQHYGVLGMHWGVRKDGGPQGYNGTYPKNRAKRSSKQSHGYTKDQIKKDLKLAKKGKVSSQRLQDQLRYLETQKKLDELVYPKKNAVKKILSKTGDKIFIGVVGGVASVIAMNYINRALDKTPLPNREERGA